MLPPQHAFWSHCEMASICPVRHNIPLIGVYFCQYLSLAEVLLSRGRRHHLPRISTKRLQRTKPPSILVRAMPSHRPVIQDFCSTGQVLSAGCCCWASTTVDRPHRHRASIFAKWAGNSSVMPPPWPLDQRILPFSLLSDDSSLFPHATHSIFNQFTAQHSEPTHCHCLPSSRL